MYYVISGTIVQVKKWGRCTQRLMLVMTHYLIQDMNNVKSRFQNELIYLPPKIKKNIKRKNLNAI